MDIATKHETSNQILRYDHTYAFQRSERDRNWKARTNSRTRETTWTGSWYVVPSVMLQTNYICSRYLCKLTHKSDLNLASWYAMHGRFYPHRSSLVPAG
jgi:hypothetical protein